VSRQWNYFGAFFGGAEAAVLGEGVAFFPFFHRMSAVRIVGRDQLSIALWAVIAL
jgi:hypothetical protein